MGEAARPVGLSRSGIRGVLGIVAQQSSQPLTILLDAYIDFLYSK